MIAGPPARLPGLPSWPRLLLPGWLGLLHLPAALSRGRKLAVGLFAVFGVAFWVGIFFAAWWFFQRCVEVELVGPLLVRKVLDMTFLVFLSVLLFSNLIAAFSTFFLADDLALVMALPLSTDSIYLARLTDTARHSSWMILIFGLPIFGAAGVVFGQAGVPLDRLASGNLRHPMRAVRIEHGDPLQVGHDLRHVGKVSPILVQVHGGPHDGYAPPNASLNNRWHGFACPFLPEGVYGGGPKSTGARAG